MPDGGAVVGAGQAAGAPHHQQPQQQRWQDAGSAPLGADEGEDGEDTEEREGSGSRNFKYNQSARKRYFALARSRRSSVGYKARGRSRIERSLDAQALLEEGKGPPVLPPPKMFATLMVRPQAPFPSCAVLPVALSLQCLLEAAGLLPSAQAHVFFLLMGFLLALTTQLLASQQGCRQGKLHEALLLPARVSL